MDYYTRVARKQEIFTMLGGRIKFRRGIYNPTCDAVWLAAAPVAQLIINSEQLTVLDVGVGTGGVSLCMLAHNPNLKITGIDALDAMLAEAASNAELNAREIELINADIMTWRTSRTFDAVVTNPPYFRGTPRQGAGGLGTAHHNIDNYEWTIKCLKRVKPKGSFCTIVDAAAMDKVIAALRDGRFGNIEIIPLLGSMPYALCPMPLCAERVIIRARLGARGGVRLYSPLSMQDARVLRDGLTIGELLATL
jgi:tRNA1(Val) A37 N6-methylase TrmN6